MKTIGHAGKLWVALVVLLCPMSLMADTIVISTTAPPALSTGIYSTSVVSTSWSASKAYTGVTIAVLVDAFIVGQTPTANAYLTTHIGPGTTATDEIAHTQFTVPKLLPVCSSGCGGVVTLFSGLSLGPGTYFLTLGSNATSNPVAAWFPALDPTVIHDTGVSEGESFFASALAPYAPASAFGAYPFAMNFTVTASSAASISEPATTMLIGFGLVLLLWLHRFQAEFGNRIQM